MITVSHTHEEHWPDGPWDADTITLTTDLPYNPTVLRDLRDAAIRMILERDDHAAELAAADNDADLDDEEGDE